MYRQVLTTLKSNLKGHRWRRAKLGAVLQHYGLKTPWLDVVRSLHTAIWFATNSIKTDGSCHVDASQKTHGWISLYGGDKDIKVNDFWRQQSSRHVRPHVQHAMSLAMQWDMAPEPRAEQDFRKYRIAQVRFPNCPKWKLAGHMFTSQFLFPQHDGSLETLRHSWVAEVLDQAREDLGGMDLGSITVFN